MAQDRPVKKPDKKDPTHRSEAASQKTNAGADERMIVSHQGQACAPRSVRTEGVILLGFSSLGFRGVTQGFRMVQSCWAEGPQALDFRFAFGSLASTLASRAREPQTPRAATFNPKRDHVDLTCWKSG